MATIRGFEFPEDLYYLIEKHVWVKPIDGELVRLGLTPVAYRLLRNSLVAISVRPKTLGQEVPKGKTVAMVESLKYIGPLAAPFAGVVVRANEQLADDPDWRLPTLTAKAGSRAAPCRVGVCPGWAADRRAPWACTGRCWRHRTSHRISPREHIRNIQKCNRPCRQDWRVSPLPADGGRCTIARTWASNSLSDTGLVIYASAPTASPISRSLW